MTWQVLGLSAEANLRPKLRFLSDAVSKQPLPLQAVHPKTSAP
jgi:hypothetical protein